MRGKAGLHQNCHSRRYFTLGDKRTSASFVHVQLPFLPRSESAAAAIGITPVKHPPRTLLSLTPWCLSNGPEAPRFRLEVPLANAVCMLHVTGVGGTVVGTAGVAVEEQIFHCTPPWGARSPAVPASSVWAGGTQSVDCASTLSETLSPRGCAAVVLSEAPVLSSDLPSVSRLPAPRQKRHLSVATLLFPQLAWTYSLHKILLLYPLNLGRMWSKCISCLCLKLKPPLIFLL